jgi:hypothetical protein
MKQQIKEQLRETSSKIQNANDEPIEYFLERCEFKFCYLEAQENFAEKIVEEIKDDKRTNNKMEY